VQHEAESVKVSKPGGGGEGDASVAPPSSAALAGKRTVDSPGPTEDGKGVGRVRSATPPRAKMTKSEIKKRRLSRLLPSLPCPYLLFRSLICLENFPAPYTLPHLVGCLSFAFPGLGSEWLPRPVIWRARGIRGLLGAGLR